MRRALIVAMFAGLLAAAQSPTVDDYDRGVAARLAGDLASALVLLERVVHEQPDNSDAQLQLGLVRLALGDLDAAEAAFRRTLELAPDYEDARIGLARVAQRRGDTAAALAELESVGPANAEARALRTRLRGSAGQYRNRLDLDLGLSRVEGQPDWREAALQLRHGLNEAIALTGRLEAHRRFGVDDVYGEIRVDHRFGDALSLWISAGGTPNADFRPEWQVGAGASARLRSGPDATILTLDSSQARYRSGDIRTLNPGIEQYFAGGRAWATLRWINLFDDESGHRSGWLARGDVMANDRLRLFAGLADAPDVSEGVVTETFSLFGGLSLDVGRRHSVRLSLAHEDREGGADRLQVSLGLGWRF